MRKSQQNFLLKNIILILLSFFSFQITVWQSPWIGPQDSSDIRGNEPDDDFFITSVKISCYINSFPKGFSITTAHSNGTTKTMGWYSVNGQGDGDISTISVNSNGPINF